MDGGLVLEPPVHQLHGGFVGVAVGHGLLDQPLRVLPHCGPRVFGQLEPLVHNQVGHLCPQQLKSVSVAIIRGDCRGWISWRGQVIGLRAHFEAEGRNEFVDLSLIHVYSVTQSLSRDSQPAVLCKKKGLSCLVISAPIVPGDKYERSL